MSRDDPLPTAGLYGPGHRLPREAANDAEVPAITLLAFLQEGRHRFRKSGGEALTTVLLKLGLEVQR